MVYACTLSLLLACRVSARLLLAVLAVCARMSRQRPSVTLGVCIWLPEWVACRLIGVLLRQEGVCLRFCSRWCVPTGYEGAGSALHRGLSLAYPSKLIRQFRQVRLSSFTGHLWSR